MSVKQFIDQDLLAGYLMADNIWDLVIFYFFQMGQCLKYVSRFFFFVPDFQNVIFF